MEPRELAQAQGQIDREGELDSKADALRERITEKLMLHGEVTLDYGHGETFRIDSCRLLEAAVEDVQADGGGGWHLLQTALTCSLRDAKKVHLVMRGVALRAIEKAVKDIEDVIQEAAERGVEVR